MTTLSNAILFALALNATPEDVEAIHDAIDRAFNHTNTIAPAAIASGDQPTNTPPSTLGNTPPANTGGVELDAAGHPWDERIHSSSKNKTAANVWKIARNIKDDLKTKVLAELTAAAAANAAPPVSTAPSVAAPAAATPLALPGSTLPLPPNAAVADPNYAALVDLIAKNTNSAANPAGRINEAWVNTVLTHYGVPEGSLPNAAHMPAVLPQIIAYINTALQG